MNLAGKSAIVTGGAGGLGAAVVRQLAGLGVGVAIFDRDAQRADALAKELGDGAATGVDGDTNNDDDVAAAIAAAQELGVFSIVVNVAGGGVPAGRTLDRNGNPHDMGAFIETMSMNAFGTFNVTRLSAAVIAGNEPDEDGQRGVIVNVGSLAGLEGQSGQVAYGAAKAAIIGMTLPLARDHSVAGIRVCTVAPGTMGTPVMLSVSDDVKERLTESIVFPKRMGKPEEFALLVESIIRNPYLNGEVIRLDGALRFPPK